MRQHRETAQKDAVTRRLKSNQRLAYVQRILQSVQTRTLPTLEDLLEELKFGSKSFDSTNSSESSQQSVNTVAEKKTSLICPLQSTTNGAFSTNHVIPEQNHKGECLVEHCEKQISQPGFVSSVNHCFVTSESVSHEIMEDATGLSENLDIRNVCHDPQGIDNSNDSFLPKTPKTITRTPDIISYPPIDGEELERSGHESSFSHDFVELNDNSFNVYLNNSSGSDRHSGEKSINSHIDIADNQYDLPSSAVHKMKEGQKMKAVLGLPLLDSFTTTNMSELPQSPIVHCSRADQPNQSNPRNIDSVGTEVPKSQSKSANRPSLQDMLKQSQEYRREQRLLRNQAKRARIQEKAQEQLKVEEKNLSDKENNEFHFKSMEGRKTKEKRFIKTINTACTKSNDNSSANIGFLIGKKANDNSEHITIPHPQPLSQSQTQELYHLTIDQKNTEPVASFGQHGTHQSIPLPRFCQSPVYNEASSCVPKGADDLREKVLISSSHIESHKADEEHNMKQQSEKPSIEVESSQHMNQLESCLSTLKELISDLGSSHVEIEGKCEDSPHRGSEVKQDQRDNEYPKRQSLDSSRSMLENSDEQINSNVDNYPSIQQDKGEEVNLAELSMANTFTLPGKINENAYHMNSGQLEGSKKQQPPVVPVLSVEKWKPVSRNVFLQPTLPHDCSAPLISNSYHLERASKAKGDHSSIVMLSVNQSLDVDTLSEGWLPEGSGSEQDSSDQLAQGKGLTPVSVTDIEAASSKVKRRLLMNVTDLDKTVAPCSEALSPVRHSYNTSKVSLASMGSVTEELKRVHAAQVKALEEEHRRQQEELRQVLTVRYCKPKSPPLPCSPSSGSRLGDTVTFSKLSQPPSSHLERCLPLLLAAVKGYLTRRLLRTEKVAQLVRTIGDTQQFLQAFQLRSPGGEICSKQDRLLWQSVTRQLRAARYDLYDIFFCLSMGERMQLISLDRELARQRVLRQQVTRKVSSQMGNTRCPKGRSSVSTTTQKSLQKKRGILTQKKSEKVSGVVLTEHKGGFTNEQSLATTGKRGWLKPKPARVSQRSYSCRPR
ncbi:uncharacterized protein cp110 isoform X2 [Corythoichthys intestinalis]|nr:uncharacterized protein si:ch73-100l22.3 isoform X2 [Corythoichthys intestinalis]